MHGLNQADGLFKFFIGLSGEANNNVAGQHQIGHDLFGVVHLLQIGLPVVVAVHGLQHPGGAGLEGEMQLLRDFGITRHGVEELLAGITRMACHEADEKIPRNLGNGGQQVGKIHAAAQILAIGVDVLPKKGDFLRAALNQRPALCENVLRLTAAFPPTDVGDDAVGAEIVAAVHDGYPCFQLGIPDLRNALGDGAGFVFNKELPLFPAEDVPQDLRKLPQMVGGKHAVHVGVAVLDAVGDLGFSRHAAAQEDFLLRVAALGVGQRAQIAENPLLGVFPDGAGVHDDHIRALGAADDGIAALGEKAPQLFGIGLVLLAAIGLHVGGGGASLCLPVGGDLITAGELGVQFGLRNDGGFGVHVGNPPDTISI